MAGGGSEWYKDTEIRGCQLQVAGSKQIKIVQAGSRAQANEPSDRRHVAQGTFQVSEPI